VFNATELIGRASIRVDDLAAVPGQEVDKWVPLGLGSFDDEDGCVSATFFPAWVSDRSRRRAPPPRDSLRSRLAPAYGWPCPPPPPKFEFDPPGWWRRGLGAASSAFG
jgi:hypothetical protein